MRTIVITVAAFANLALAQLSPNRHRSSQDAAIISDTRYLAGDGTFGAAYTQEDGVEFEEESDANGDRKGSYSYVDPSGHRRTVFYTAGKNGFQASGDDIATARPVVAPTPEYEPLVRHDSPDYRPPRPGYPALESPRSHYHARQSIPEPRYQDPPPLRYRPRASPSYRPSYRPPSAIESEPVFQHHPRFRYQPAAPRSRYNEIAGPPPRAFHPPGKLDFVRTPDGFSYTFSKS